MSSVRYSHSKGWTRAKMEGAFSLIELLVLIAILAILMAVLISAVGKSRSKVEGVKCISNLKTISLGVNGYLADNSGVYPPAQLPQLQTLWYHVIQPYIDGSERAVTSTSHPDWLNCPSKRFSTTNRLAVGYGWNYIGFGDTITDSAGKTRTFQVSRPAETLLAGDSPDTAAAKEWWQNVYIYSQTNLMAQRHGGRGNYLFIDGHIESFTPGKLVAEYPRVFQSIKTN